MRGSHPLRSQVRPVKGSRLLVTLRVDVGVFSKNTFVLSKYLILLYYFIRVLIFRARDIALPSLDAYGNRASAGISAVVNSPGLWPREGVLNGVYETVFFPRNV